MGKDTAALIKIQGTSKAGLEAAYNFKIHEENPCILGMIAKVKYLVKVEKI